jgi:hypothetical protein
MNIGIYSNEVSKMRLEIMYTVFMDLTFILKVEFPNLTYIFKPNLTRKSQHTKFLIDILDRGL